tara:strand:- start:302 stop:1081 length:780 start_codon:yes stop_codon:yes gene_type:complete
MENYSGEIFRLKREEIDLSIEEVSSYTKISKHILKKIEDSDLKNISVFQKKYFTRAYAKFLGIDEVVRSENIFKEETLILKGKDFNIGISSIINNNYVFPRIIISILILFSFIFIFLGYQKSNHSYLEKLVYIDNKLSEDSSIGDEDENLYINNLPYDNIQSIEPQVESVSTKDIFNKNTLNNVLYLYFKGEVWIEIENDEEIILSRVFQKDEEVSLEVIKEDSVFITSGNLGLITVKTNHSEEKELGLNGEIGRKKIF